LGLDLVEPLRDQPRKPRRPPMGEEKKDEGAGDPIKMLLEEALEKQRNAMMDNFARFFNGFRLAVHRHPETTLEVPLLLRYK
jgi:hypothetical protein